MPHKHKWITVYSDGEVEQQDCACGRSRDVVYDFQDNSVHVDEYDREEV